MPNKIDDLFGDDAATPSAYWTDLERVVELEAQGKKRPTFAVLRDYLNSTHGTKFCESSIKSHYKQVKHGR